MKYLYYIKITTGDSAGGESGGDVGMELFAGGWGGEAF